MHRDFDAARRVRARLRDPVTFTAGGHTFTCVASPVLADVFDLMDCPDVETVDGIDAIAVADSPEKAVRVMARMIRALLTPDERPTWDEVLAADVDRIDARQVIEIGAWLGEVFSGRPTRRSAASDGGPSSDGPISTDGASGVVSPISPVSVSAAGSS